MPLVRIDVIEGRSDSDLRALADTLHECAVEAFTLPDRDRFQIITEHKPSHMIIQDVNLGFDRTQDVVVVQLTSTPRSTAARKQFFETAAKRLQKRCGLDPKNLVINIVTASEGSWSFADGRAQFLTGEL